jgi:hypothetical protein
MASRRGAEDAETEEFNHGGHEGHKASICGVVILVGYLSLFLVFFVVQQDSLCGLYASA